MNIIEIPYRALISVPLYYLDSHKVATTDLIDYKINIAKHAAFKGIRIDFESPRDAKLFFEITRHPWLNITPLECGESEYTIKPGAKIGLKQEIDSIDRSVIELLSNPNVLQSFDKGNSKSLTNKRPQ